MSSHGATVTHNAHGASNRATAARAAPKPRAPRAATAGGGTTKRAATSRGKAGKASAAPTPRAAPKTTPLQQLAQEEAKSKPPSAGELRRVRISDIKAEINPRELFDPEALAELAANIKEHGGEPMQPPTVRPKGDGTYQLIAGERRMRAMQALGKTEMNVIVRNVSEAEARELALTENIARKDMTPSETGRAYQALLSRGMSEDDLLKTIGKTSESARQSVKDHLALVNTIEPYLQKLVDEAAGGKRQGLAFSLVGPLARLTPEHRQAAAERIMGKHLGVGPAKALIAELRRQENQASLFDVPKVSAKSQAAHERYSASMEKLTQILGGLDDQTMEAMIPSLANPMREQTNIDLAIKQLQRMRTIVGRSIARDAAAGM